MQSNRPHKEEISGDLLERFSRGDHQAFEAIYWRYNAKIFNFVNSILHDTFLAEDVVQSLFLKLWEKRETINPELCFSSYLFTIAKNLVLKQTSAFHRYELLTEETASAVMPNSVESEMDARLLKEYVDRVVEQFPSVRRKVYELSRYNHLSTRQIAEKLFISERTVETHLYRALKELKAKIGEHGVLLALLFFRSIL